MPGVIGSSITSDLAQSYALVTHMEGWGPELKSWEAWLKAAARRPGTIEQHLYHVGRMAREIRIEPYAVTTGDIAAWLGGQTWAAETIKSYRSSIRSFYQWATALGRTGADPSALLPPVKVPRGTPRPTPEDVYRAAMLKADSRERLMLELAAICGLRRGEIAAVRAEDVEADLIGSCLRVIGKGGHVRRIPIPDGLARKLRDAGPGWVFPSPSLPAPLTAHHVGKIVSRLLPEGWSCHSLRHRCATIAYQSTHDIRAVQLLLGHASVATTERYTQIENDAVRAAMRAAAVA
jgi:integrase/recombinase XerC